MGGAQTVTSTHYSPGGGTRPCQGIYRPLVERSLQQDCRQLGSRLGEGMSLSGISKKLAGLGGVGQYSMPLSH